MKKEKHKTGPILSIFIVLVYLASFIAVVIQFFVGNTEKFLTAVLSFFMLKETIGLFAAVGDAVKEVKEKSAD